MLKGIATAAAGLLVVGLIALLAKVAGGGAQVEKGRTVLRYGRGFRAVGLMGVVAALVALSVFLVLLLMGQLSDGAVAGVSVLCLVFLGPAVPLLIEGYRRQIVLDDEGISARGWWGPVGEFEWSEITKVENNVMAGKFIVRAGKKKIALGHYLEGLDVFAAECQKRLTPEVYGGAFGKPLNRPFV